MSHFYLYDAILYSQAAFHFNKPNKNTQWQFVCSRAITVGEAGMVTGATHPRYACHLFIKTPHSVKSHGIDEGGGTFHHKPLFTFSPQKVKSKNSYLANDDQLIFSVSGFAFSSKQHT